MYVPLVHQSPAAAMLSPLRFASALILVAALCSSIASGQINVRPVDPGTLPIFPGGGGPGGGIIGGGPIGGGGIGFPFIPFNPFNPGNVVTNPGPRIVTDPGILTGQTTQASVVVPDQPATAAASATQPVAATRPTYQWAISGGRITTDPAEPFVRFTSDAAGSVTLNVVIIGAGPIQSASIEVPVLSPALAGTITAPATARAGTASLTATIPGAQAGDRTFRWSVAGSGAAIMSGQGTNQVTVRPGGPGLLEVNCDVTLQRLAT